MEIDVSDGHPTPDYDIVLSKHSSYLSFNLKSYHIMKSFSDIHNLKLNLLTEISINNTLITNYKLNYFQSFDIVYKIKELELNNIILQEKINLIQFILEP